MSPIYGLSTFISLYFILRSAIGQSLYTLGQTGPNAGGDGGGGRGEGVGGPTSVVVRGRPCDTVTGPTTLGNGHWYS